jgi:hypothetical protein
MFRRSKCFVYTLSHCDHSDRFEINTNTCANYEDNGDDDGMLLYRIRQVLLTKAFEISIQKLSGSYLYQYKTILPGDFRIYPRFSKRTS